MSKSKKIFRFVFCGILCVAVLLSMTYLGAVLIEKYQADTDCGNGDDVSSRWVSSDDAISLDVDSDTFPTMTDTYNMTKIYGEEFCYVPKDNNKFSLKKEIDTSDNNTTDIQYKDIAEGTYEYNSETDVNKAKVKFTKINNKKYDYLLNKEYTFGKDW